MNIEVLDVENGDAAPGANGNGVEDAKKSCDVDSLPERLHIVKGAARPDPREGCTATMRQALDFLLPDPKAVFELAVFSPKHVREGACWPGFTPDDRIVVGWFNDKVKAANLAHSVDRIHIPAAIYVTLNRVAPALLARSNNELAVSKKGGRTVAENILHIDNILIDVDPKRVSGVSSTRDEKAEAQYVMTQVVAHLQGLGFPDPLLCDSGNGYHAIYAVDLPVEDAPIVAGVLNALGNRFDTSKATVDRSVSSLNQITKFYGTMARKGANMPDRPWRLSKIISRPERVVVPRELLAALAAEVEVVAKTETTQTDQATCGGFSGSDEQLLVKMRTAKNGAKFAALFDDGDVEAYPSKSEADMALLAILAFWTGRDPDRMDELFRASALYSLCERWDTRHYANGETYGEHAIKVACERCREVYTPPALAEVVPSKMERGAWADLDIHQFAVKRYLATKPEPLDYAFGNMRVGTMGIIVGPPGTGKTHLCQHIAAAVATGSATYMDDLFSVERKGRVVIFSAEDDREAIHDRVWRQFQDAFEPFGDDGDIALTRAKADIEDNIFIVPAAGMDIRLVQKTPEGPTTLGDYHQLVKWIGQLDNLRLVIFDPMIKFYGGEENDNAFADYFSNRLVNMAQTLGVAVLCAHHTVKGFQKTSGGVFSLDKALDQDAARGASAFTGAAAWQYNLIPLPGDHAKKCIESYQAGHSYLSGKVSKCRYGKKAVAPSFFEVLSNGTLHSIEGTYGKDDKAAILSQSKLADLMIEAIREKEEREAAGEQLLTANTFSRVYAPLWKEEGATVRGLESLAKALVSEGRLRMVERKYGRRVREYLATTEAVDQAA